jgi:hypothetical protein
VGKTRFAFDKSELLKPSGQRLFSALAHEQRPSANDILLRYTSTATPTSIGQVTLDDVCQFLDGHPMRSAATNNWFNGGFDHGGAVTLDELRQFLFAYQEQGAPVN